jgi:hypothetical protein
MPVASGLYNFLTQNVAAAGVQALLSALAPIGGVAQFPVYISRADKEPPASYIVIHIVNAPPVAHSLAGPSTLQDGEFQFDSYGPDALSAQALSNAVKAALENFAGDLSDGSTFEVYEITWDADEGYEVGGGSGGYVFKHALRLQVFYSETTAFPLVTGFNFVLNSGLSGAVGGIESTSAQVTLSTGGLASGNPLTAAVFQPAGAFESGSFSGTWNSNVVWEQVGESSTYILSGMVSNETQSNVPVLITLSNVVFTGDPGTWSN